MLLANEGTASAKPPLCRLRAYSFGAAVYRLHQDASVRYPRHGPVTAKFMLRRFICKVPLVIRMLRQWVMRRLGIRSEEAANGEWWEIDLIIAFLFAITLAGGVALMTL
jgi:hypothetical protein